MGGGRETRRVESGQLGGFSRGLSPLSPSILVLVGACNTPPHILCVDGWREEGRNNYTEEERREQ